VPEFTYEAPDPQAFLYTLRSYLQAAGHNELAILLLNSTCEVSSSGSFSGQRWNAFSATMRYFVPIAVLPRFTAEMRAQLLTATQVVFPTSIGYDILDCEVSPLLQAPPEEEKGLLNSASLVSSGPIEHDGLRFRSRSEVRIYDALKQRKILFFANATAVLGGKGVKREPDFLVCQDGKWGILEVMGEQYHPSSTAMRDHDRARLFKDYGLYYIEFYSADQCYDTPDAVVADFLERLSKY
jgi:hypothetical protein